MAQFCWPLTPQFWVAANGRAPLDLAALIDNAERLSPQTHVQSIWLNHSVAQVSVAPRQNPVNGQPYTLDYDQLILNPYTGEELGRREWGAISQGMINLMPFIYQLHYALALDDLGGWILGITALVWTLDCFVGFYLTLPLAKSSRRNSNSALPPQRSFVQRWLPAWTIKWRASKTRINFDLHRAGGLWLWLLLLIFAWSSVYMNLGEQAYKPVMQAVSEFHQPWTEFPDLDKPIENPAISWREACQIGKDAMNRAAVAQGFSIEAPVAISLNKAKGFYVYNVRTSLDIQDHRGQTRVVIDAMTGAEKLLLLPTSQYNGNTLTTWLIALHMANVFGLPYRILVCILGLAIVVLSVTGVIIWLKKRQRRQA